MPESPHRSIGKIKSVLLFPGPEKEPLSTAQIQELQKTIQELNATVANLNETIAEFRRKFFGTSRESAAGRDPEEETGQEGQTEESTVRSHTRRKPKAKPEELYKNLPVGEVHCAMPEGQRLCPDYDAPMETIGWQFVREELRITPAKVERIQYLHEVLACPVCREEDTGTIVKAPVPTALLAHRPASPSMAAFVMYQKFLNSVIIQKDYPTDFRICKTGRLFIAYLSIQIYAQKNSRIFLFFRLSMINPILFLVPILL